MSKVEIKIPAMGESISEVIIGQILKPSGTTVKADDEILEIETDKINQVLYAPAAGTITLNVKPEEKVPVGKVIGFVDSEISQTAASPTPPPPPSPTPAAPPAPKLELVPGSIRKSVDQFIQETRSEIPVPEKREIPEKKETRKRLSSLRRTLATRLVEAKNSTAMLTTFNEVNMSVVISLREKYKEIYQKQYGVKLGFTSFFVKAVVHALKAVPGLNSYIDGDDLVERNTYDIGVAVGTERGLVVPVIRGCDQLKFPELEGAIQQFATKAREGKLTLDDLQGGSFTITNGGVYGSLLSTPILNPPQSGILGMHKIQERPIAEAGEVVIRPMMYIALSYDHRVVDGKEAVTFLVHVKNLLEDPARFLLEE